ncbi:alpha/beta-hydrolase [Bimuria novae-zelandiae CBS 107.79]|uniref:Alpha/beta-hydrolase n=1 Tax=Bimuria novae-zelandiae CBS 107.79 TaxID=1447943 RepID=A0A6A5V4I0_9PLEO|nr:alpha/beta-hydrolase [Bimuria novae-zelandiae CBS 107.79]
MPDYSTLPATASGKIERFSIHIPEQELQDFQTLLRLSPIVQDTYENQDHARGGRPRAKKTWETFDWRAVESHINTFPHFKAHITDDDGTPYTIHFAALFSHRADAIPLIRLSGWPASLESLPLLTLLAEKYTPETLPYHVILPAQPGWPFSSAPPLGRDWGYADSARVLQKLLVEELGLKRYAICGGDIGAGIARIMASSYAEAAALHTNYAQMPRPDSVKDDEVDAFEKEGVERGERFMSSGTAYGMVQGTRPGTLAAVLAASPLALLTWIGEKYLAWADPRTPIPLEHILTTACLYWFSGASATTLYPYREDYVTKKGKKGYLHGQEELYVDKPVGYSYFPKELVPVPRKWVETTGRVVWCRGHGVGGHFPGLEVPGALLGDLEEFLGEVWG